MTKELLAKLDAKEIQFADVIKHIDANYTYTPSAFVNGIQENAEDHNQGSAKVLYFAQLNNLSKEDTLLLFAEHYEAVLQNPNGTDHQNIRQFMLNGWDGVRFNTAVLG